MDEELDNMAHAEIPEFREIIDDGLEKGAENLTEDKIRQVINCVLSRESSAAAVCFSS